MSPQRALHGIALAVALCTSAASWAAIVPAGTVHDAHNPSDTATRLIGVYVVEKGKPLATPAP